MQNYCKTIGALAAASALVAGNAQAEVEYELGTGYSTQYNFRGVTLGDNLWETTVNTAGEWNNVGLSAGMWAGVFNNATTAQYSPVAAADSTSMEVDFYTEAAYDFGFMTGAVGYIYYWNVGSLGQDAQEVYFSIGRDFGWAETSFTYFWDVEGLDNNGYSKLDFGRGFELSPCLTLQANTGIGYLFEKGKFADWTTKLALDWGFSENAVLSPYVALSVPCLGGSNNTAYATQNTQVWTGALLNVSF